jgi:hypothetical protein
MSQQPSRRAITIGCTSSVPSPMVPLRECAAGAGHVWTAQGRDALRDVPAVDPTRPLLREHEVTICSHYGVGEGAGRRARVAGRAEGSVTARPAV